ncbi:DUF1566 domain-containing protein, partial [bacterium]|nr:DUF1566 domain-containing protein [bacterium]
MQDLAVPLVHAVFRGIANLLSDWFLPRYAMFPTAHPYAHFLRAWLTVLALLGAWPAHAVFSDNGDGTVTDTLTLLIWDKCSWGQSGNTCATGSASNYTWAAALGIAARAKAAHYKGHNDWRLPNVAELESLVKRDTSNPAIDRTAFPNTSSERYWSSTIYTPNPAYAWYVHFGNGGTGAGNQSYNGHVRLVRSGQSLGSFDRQSPRSAQTVTFGSAQSVAVGGAATLSATASSGLPVTFSSLTASICTVSGNTVTGIATGTCIIAANQAGNSSTSPAAQVTQSFSIAAPATYTLTVNSSGAAGVAIISLPTTYAGTSNYSKSGIAAGTRIMLTAPTATGNSTFNRWSGCDVASGVTCSVTMNAAKSVT